MSSLHVNRRELRPPPPPHRLDQGWIAVVDKIQERGGFAVLFPHEQQRNVGRQQDGRSRDLERLEGNPGTQSIAEGPVADLVVILREDDEVETEAALSDALPWRLRRYREYCPEYTYPSCTGDRQVPEPFEVLKVPFSFLRQRRPECMVKVVSSTVRRVHIRPAREA